jgi:hypothetical protein
MIITVVTLPLPMTMLLKTDIAVMTITRPMRIIAELKTERSPSNGWIGLLF